MVIINPIKALCGDCTGKSMDLAEINNQCYEICAAFSGTTNPYNMDPNCTRTCDEFLENEKIKTLGVGNCDHQAPYKPVIWDQVPNFVPNLVRQGMSPENALKMGMQMCSQQVPKLAAECQEKCKLHFAAIEPYKETETVMKREKKKESKKSPTTWIVIGGLLVFFAVIMLLFYVKSKN